METDSAERTEEESKDSPDFRSDLSSLLNRYSKENNSNTPDYILRDYLCNCLKAFDTAVKMREQWHEGWITEEDNEKGSKQCPN
jgi:hypothetical protein